MRGKTGIFAVLISDSVVFTTEFPEDVENRTAVRVFSPQRFSIPLEKQRNSFSDFENTTLFAHRRRNAEDSSTPDARFRQRRRIRRRGEGTRHADILRSVYVRAHDARDNCKIRPEICPDTRAWTGVFEKLYPNSVVKTT